MTPPGRTMATVGVLALQGAARAHRRMLEHLGVSVREVRRPAHLDDVEALVIPGGESTTISLLLDRSGLRHPLVERLSGGMAVLGTCAGAILLASDVRDGRDDRPGLDVLDMTVRRNGFGRQLASFEADLSLELDPPLGGSSRAVFIRAPRIERVGLGIEVVARYGGEPVAVAAGGVWATTFHPELTDDLRLHRAWLESTNREARKLA